MKQMLPVLVVLVIILIILFTRKLSLSQENKITPEGVKKLIDEKTDIFLLDVRTQKEYDKTHIEGVVLIPIKEVENRLSEIPKDKDVIVLCAIGGRSKVVTKFLLKNGYTRIFDMKGGIVNWQKKGLPVVK